MTDFSTSTFDTKEKIIAHFEDVPGPDLGHFFNHNLVGEDLEKVRQVANLLEKVNLASKKIFPDEILLREIESEKSRSTIGYVVLKTGERSDGNYVEAAIRRLEDLRDRFSSYNSLKKDFSFFKLRDILKGDKTKLAKLKEYEVRFSLIEEEMKELIKEEEAYDRMIEKEQKNIKRFQEDLEEIDKKIEMCEKDDGLGAKYREYLSIVDKWRTLCLSDGSKTNEYFVRDPIHGRVSITGAELRQNILYFFIKEYLEHVNPENVDVYLTKKGLCMKPDSGEKTSQEIWNNIVDITKKVIELEEYEKLSRTDPDKLKEFKFVVWVTDKGGIGKRIMWEVARGVRQPFPYRDFFILMKRWFKKQSDGKNPGYGDEGYAAFVDEDNNPFKEAGLLKKENKLTYAFSGDSISLDDASISPGINPIGGRWLSDSVDKRSDINIVDLPTAIRTFFDFFTPENEKEFLATAASESWQVLTGSGEVQENYVDGNDDLNKEMTSIDNYYMKDPAKVFDEQKLKKNGKIGSAKIAIDLYTKKKLIKS